MHTQKINGIALSHLHLSFIRELPDLSPSLTRIAGFELLGLETMGLRRVKSNLPFLSNRYITDIYSSISVFHQVISPRAHFTQDTAPTVSPLLDRKSEQSGPQLPTLNSGTNSSVRCGHAKAYPHLKPSWHGFQMSTCL